MNIKYKNLEGRREGGRVGTATRENPSPPQIFTDEWSETKEEGSNLVSSV